MMYPLVRELAGDGIPITVTCRVLKIARQPYYRWLKNPITTEELDEAYRANALFDAHRDDPEFGYRYLADEARDAMHAYDVAKAFLTHPWCAFVSELDIASGGPPAVKGGLLLYLGAALGIGGFGLIVSASLAEHILGGAATVAVFALMMDAADRDYAGSDYTLMACAIVVVQGIAGFAAGAVGELSDADYALVDRHAEALLEEFADVAREVARLGTGPDEDVDLARVSVDVFTDERAPH